MEDEFSENRRKSQLKDSETEGSLNEEIEINIKKNKKTKIQKRIIKKLTKKQSEKIIKKTILKLEINKKKKFYDKLNK